MSTTDTRRVPQTDRTDSPWLRRFARRERASARLVCFPHAGGTADAFAALSAALPEDVELVAVQYPGRQERRGDPAAEDLGALAAAAAEAIVDLSHRPLSLLGHSMGALVAFETARLLEQRVHVVRLFVSSARPPAGDWADPDLDARDDHEVVARLRQLGGVPERLLGDPGSLREVLRVLRADLLSARRYSCPPDAAVSAPVTVFLAREDPKNNAEQVAGWGRHTTAGHGVEVLEGGHFALVDRGATAAPVIARLVREDLGPAEQEAPADLIRDIYLAGAAPRLSTDLTSLEQAAREVLTSDAYGYVAGNAGTGATARANREAFDRWRLVPHVMRDVGRRDLSVELFGTRLEAPVAVAPVAAQTVVHPEGELASARAAADVGALLVLSTLSSYSLEDVAGAAGAAPRWFQLYWPAKQSVAESLVRRAEASGCTAVVVTVDAPVLGYRPQDLDGGYLPFLRGTGIANFTGDPAFRAGLPANAGTGAVVEHWARVFTNPRLSWADLPVLRALTNLPILVKGILRADDARRARDAGADGLVVSNHGGRQVDGAVAALDALPAVRAAVGPTVPVLMDSGVRTGADVVKALALGADAVLYGRPYLYGLGLDGQRGVTHVLRCLLAEVDSVMSMTGCTRIADLSSELLAAPGPLGAG